MWPFDTIASVWDSQQLAQRTVEHLSMFSAALVISAIIGIVLGVAVYKHKRLADVLFNILNVVETIPTLALLVLFLPILGLGSKPTVAASIIYSILPIARNTYTGLTTVDDEYIYVSRALGFTERDTLLRVRIPLAFPLIMGGIRIALAFIMGVVTLGGLIAAGGLGAPIQTGIQLYDTGIIVVTGLWVGFLALIFDFIVGRAEVHLGARS